MRNAMKWCVSCDGRKAFAALIVRAAKSSRMATTRPRFVAGDIVAATAIVALMILRAPSLRGIIIADRQEPVVLEGEVECDEVYVVAGHKGHPAAVQKKGEKAAAAV